MNLATSQNLCFATTICIHLPIMDILMDIFGTAWLSHTQKSSPGAELCHAVLPQLANCQRAVGATEWDLFSRTHSADLQAGRRIIFMKNLT